MNNTLSVPLVSIICETYNHEKYIRNCLDGFIQQVTNFDFEILIHDDASTDKTPAIIHEYASHYSTLFKPILQLKNQYTKGVKIWSEIQFPRVKGKYVAFCEGDDYWTDPLKLQKQVDFLESHPDFMLCFNKIEVVNEHLNKNYALANVETREYLANEILESMLLQTASVVIRRDVIDSQRYVSANADKRIRSGDIILYLSAAAMGRIYCIADTMSVYRINSGGVTNAMRRDPFMFVNEVKYMNESFGDLYPSSFKNNLAKGYIRTLFIGIKTFNLKVTLKSLGGISRYIWYFKFSSLQRSITRKMRELFI